MPGGRPRTFNFEESLEKALELTRNPEFSGIKTIVELCRHLNISTDTWYRYVKKHKNDAEYSDPIKKINDNLLCWWINVGLSGKVNNTAWVFCMKNIFRWTDRQDVQATVKEFTHADIVDYIKKAKKDAS